MMLIYLLSYFNYMENKNALIGIFVVVLVAIAAIVGFVVLSDDEEDGSDNNTETTQENNEEEAEATSPTQNIVETAIATPDLSTLVAAVEAGELVEALSDESTMLTVFAPTNDAFAAIQSTVDTLLLPENQADLQNVLQYHVVEGKVMSTDLSDGMTVTALNGDTLTITIDANNNVFVNGAQVTLADVETSNGVVHLIDAVLVP